MRQYLHLQRIPLEKLGSRQPNDLARLAERSGLATFNAPGSLLCENLSYCLLRSVDSLQSLRHASESYMSGPSYGDLE